MYVHGIRALLPFPGYVAQKVNGTARTHLIYPV